MKPDRQAIVCRTVEDEARTWPTLSVDADSAAEELIAAYTRLATQYPDETFSRDLIGSASTGKLCVGLFVALAAVLIILIARGIGAWV
jgi:hypothetical protein